MNIKNYQCPNCGAELFWDSDKECLACRYCGHKYEPNTMKDISSRFIAIKDDNNEQFYSFVEKKEKMLIYRCSSCHAEVVVSEGTIVSVCPYCNRTMTMLSEDDDFKPELIIPFALNKQEAIKKYKIYMHKSTYIPSEFKEIDISDKIQGVFVPFFLHSFDIKTSHSLGENCIVADASCSYERVPSGVSSKFDNKLINAICPFDYEKAKPFNFAYMVGYLAEKANKNSTIELDDNIKKICEKTMSVKALKTYRSTKTFTGYDSATLQNTLLSKEFSNHVVEYILSPIWIVNLEYKKRLYTYAINGETGKTFGNLPFDKKEKNTVNIKKCVLFFLILAVIIFII